MSDTSVPLSPGKKETQKQDIPTSVHATMTATCQGYSCPLIRWPTSTRVLASIPRTDQLYAVHWTLYHIVLGIR